MTRSDGVPASIFDVLPTPVLDDSEVGRIDTDAFDGVIYDDDSDSTLSSGNLQWRELLVEGMSSCGRSVILKPIAYLGIHSRLLRTIIYQKRSSGYQ